MRTCLKAFSAFFLGATLSACATTPPTPATLDDLAAPAAMTRETFPSGSFILTTYARIGDENAPATIYIEGEDRPFARAPAIDATPAYPLAFHLAMQDPSVNVIYIARPCQITENDPACAPKLIKSGRFADQVLASVNRAIDHYATRLSMPRLNLVGTGNGGAVAAILAARRYHDAVSLRTIGGNLDPEGLARSYGYDGADDLLNPMPIAHRLAMMPQEHFVGSLDTVIPPFTTANFIKETGATPCTVMIRIEGASHLQGWDRIWRGIAANPPVCKAGRNGQS